MHHCAVHPPRRSRLWHEARVVHDEALEAHALDAHVVSLVVKLVQAGARLRGETGCASGVGAGAWRAWTSVGQVCVATG
eukprot:68917-Chlamydomonas_euryale.AAC.1